MCYHRCMIRVYVISSAKGFSQSIKAKLQKRDANGRFSKPHQNHPLVSFYYPMRETPWNSKLRQVRLISATATHLTGLEVTKVGSKYKYQFKKFLQPKVSEFKVQEFNPASMS